MTGRWSDPGVRHRRAIAQLAEHRSPKPKVGGSSPSCPAELEAQIETCRKGRSVADEEEEARPAAEPSSRSDAVSCEAPALTSPTVSTGADASLPKPPAEAETGLTARRPARPRRRTTGTNTQSGKVLELAGVGAIATTARAAGASGREGRRGGAQRARPPPSSDQPTKPERTARSSSSRSPSASCARSSTRPGRS